jgi:glycosyltransferase involved in cell wall biosynthesis
MEAMACGLPVLAPKIGGISEIIQSEVDGWLLPSYSSYELYIDKISQILNIYYSNQEFFKLISVNASLKIEEKFSLDSMIHAYEKLYNELS